MGTLCQIVTSFELKVWLYYIMTPSSEDGTMTVAKKEAPLGDEVYSTNGNNTQHFPPKIICRNINNSFVSQIFLFIDWREGEWLWIAKN